MIKKIVIMFLVMLSMINIANAEILYNETFYFYGANILFENPTNSGISGSNSITPQNSINVTTINFDNGKIIDNIFAKDGNVWLSTGTYIPQLSTSSNGINSKYTPFDSYVDNIYYGSGVLGWERTSGYSFGYYIFFDTVDSSYANTLTGFKNINYVYNTSVFSSYIANSDTTNKKGQLVYQNNGSLYITTYSSGFGCNCLAGYSDFHIAFQYTDIANVKFNNISNTFGYINLTKNFVAYRFNITDSNHKSYYDVTSSSDVSELVNYSNGLEFSLHHIGLDSGVNRTVIDISGSNELSYEMNFNKSYYRLNDDVQLNYSINNMDSTKNYRIRVHQITDDNILYENIYYPVSSSGYIIPIIEKNLKSVIYANLFQDSEILLSKSVSYGSSLNYSGISGNISIDKSVYNLSETVTIKYNVSDNGFIAITCPDTVYQKNVNLGYNQQTTFYINELYLFPCYVKLYVYTPDLTLIDYDVFETIESTDSINFVESYVNLGGTINIHYSTINNSYIVLNDSNNETKLNMSVETTNGQTKLITYVVSQSSVSGIWVIGLYNNSNLLASDSIVINENIESSTISTTSSETTNLLDFASYLSQSLIGKTDMNNDNKIDDDEIKDKGNKIFDILLLICLLIVTIGSYNFLVKRR